MHSGASRFLSHQTFTCHCRPYPLILGSILLANTTQAFYPIEFTPLYIGAPAAYTNTTPALGNGFVEPIGFNSPPPKTVMKPSNPANRTDPGIVMQVEVDPLFVVPLKVMVGISSSFLTQGVRPATDFKQDLTGTQLLEYWNQIDFKGGQLPFADGGASDNLAVTMLLRRRVQHIVACVSSNKPLNSNITSWAAYQWDVSALFGAVPVNDSQLRNGSVNGVPVPVYNRALQVSLAAHAVGPIGSWKGCTQIHSDCIYELHINCTKLILCQAK